MCRGADLNRGTTKDKVLSLAPLARLGYPCSVLGITISRRNKNVGVRFFLPVDWHASPHVICCHPVIIARLRGKDLIVKDALQSIGGALYEIRFHGRGGQGAVIASEVLANAAFREGYHVTAFPFFGVERRGAPVTAFTRLSKEPILVRSGIYEPDFVVVLDESLLMSVNVLEGLKKGGSLLVNTRHRPEELPVDSDHKKFTVDATGIAVKNGLGSPTTPIVNTAILGAFAKVSKLVTLNSVIESVRAIAPVKKDENAAATKEAYGQVLGV